MKTKTLAAIALFTIAAAPTQAQDADVDLIDCFAQNYISSNAGADVFDGNVTAQGDAMVQTLRHRHTLMWLSATESSCSISQDDWQAQVNASLTDRLPEAQSRMEAGETETDIVRSYVLSAAQCMADVSDDRIAQLPDGYENGLPCGWTE